MDRSEIERILSEHASGSLSSGDAAAAIEGLAYDDLGFAKVDHAREKRQGFPEVVFGLGKEPDQIAAIFGKLVERSPNVLVTRTTPEVFGILRNICTDAEWHESARLVRVLRKKDDLGVGEISVVTAGTSDVPVAEEAALTAEAMGNKVVRIWDVGVAGIHRILSQRHLLKGSRVVIVAAGMEGALPSVVGGLVSVPVVAVPTSIGYGASFEGVAALLGMLNSCSSNVVTVNIDNGFGAGFAAALINRKWKD
ncbi:MAG: nickel pincer cofactor biosynthesis protein LarB [Acidobacteria bacterium]|nr:MAG: nickel pincer cofactor biosynthesis protein LarB [Acidobacteriota bacterium]REK02045.1 MAG: nickel pincer cofactor biosynthesis protein LarB [Acidobacteriota bacterium]REK15003.1 MAG: nickel pincer cofactor biosynthesis protein LarB [Acidobacteriota bacterium]REK45717.1 MAG: nickel pincer cofactor biosynthesis protein LarB [Acidobacteriota bacterium]